MIKNNLNIARSIKRDTTQFVESQTSMDCQDIWTLPTTMDAFGICACVLSTAVQLSVHPSAVTLAELIEFFGALRVIQLPHFGHVTHRGL